jgi:hypothetical protein
MKGILNLLVAIIIGILIGYVFHDILETIHEEFNQCGGSCESDVDCSQTMKCIKKECCVK